MNASSYTYMDKLWSVCPTKSDSDSFFHSAFGTRVNDGQEYFDQGAKLRRTRWATFLTYFKDKTMPPFLTDVLKRCLSVNDKYRYASIDKQNFEKYVSDITASKRNVTMDEIPILATLENTIIVMLSDKKADAAIIVKPNSDILGSYPNVPENPKEVILCLEGNTFSRMEPVNENPKSKSDENNTKKKSIPDKYKKGGSAGSKGVEYQVSLLALVMLKTLRNGLSQWRLSTENEEAGKFDDVVLECSSGDVLIQCKHKENRSRITLEELLSTNSKNDDFSLPKYFLSYQLIKTKFKINDIIICTNADVHEKVLEFIDCPNAYSDSILNYEDGNSSFYMLNEKMLPVLKENTKKYLHQSFKNKNINESVITDDNLNDFFKHLQLFFNYPSRSCLADIIDKLLSLIKCCSNTRDKIFSSEIYFRVMEWFQKKDGVYLTEIHAKAMFSDIWRDKYCQELDQYEVTFQKNDLNFQGPVQAFQVTFEDGYLLQVIKTYHTIQSSRKKTLFVNLDDDVDVQNQVVEVFSLPLYLFLVIIWPTTADKSEMVEIYSKLKDPLEQWRYKKVIFVSEGNNEMIQQIGLKEVVQFDSCVTFEDLSKVSQGRLLKSRNVDFQGKTTNLDELFSLQKIEDCTVSLDSGTLERLVRGEVVKVGVHTSGLDNDTARCYISRAFKKEIHKETNGSRGKEKRNVFWEESIYDMDDKLVLIVDSAGMGKSTVLTRLATIIKEKNPHLWVIKVNLNDYTEILRKSLRKNKRKITVTELLNSHEATKLRSRLEEFVFSIKGKVVLMLDAVDEISPDYTDLILDLLTQCQNATNFAKIFVTTRPHLIHEMEKILKVSSFKMVPFTELNQTDFLTRYWTHNLQIRGDTNYKKCKIYAATLISKMSTWVKSFDHFKNHFTAIPLQVKMLAETFQDSTRGDDWEGLKEFLSGDEAEPKLPEKFNVAELYNMFIKKKREIFLDKGSGNTVANQALIDKFTECLPYHRNLALKVILSKTQRDLFSHSHLDDKDVESYLLKIGVVQKLGDEFQFVHRTFAEYFVAESILIELKIPNPNVEFQRFVIDKILQKPEFNMIRAFLDNFLQKAINFLPSMIFENYLYKYKNDNVSSGDLIFTLSEEGCVVILRLVLESIHLNTTKGIKTKLRDFFNTTKNSNTLIHLQVSMRKSGFNAWDWQGYTPLHLASEGGHLETVKFLIEQGANFNIRRLSDGCTPLHLVLKSDNLDITKYLLGCGADVNITDDYGCTALHLACGNLDIVKRIVELGANFNVTDGRGRTVLHLAAESGYIDTVKYIMELGVDVRGRDGDGCSVLHFAAKSGNLGVVKHLVECDVDINGRDNRGRTVLHSAAYSGSWDVVEYLVNRGAYINSKDRSSCTVLYLAADFGNWNTVKYLVELGADVNISNRTQCTVLHLAVKGKDLDTVAYLVQNGAYINSRDVKGDTPLILAAESGEWEIVQYLAKRGAYINSRDSEGRTLLHLAVASGNWDVIECLMDLEIDVNCKNVGDRTALDVAIKSGNWDIVKYLVERGADPNNRDVAGRTPLHYAVASNHLDSIKNLIEYGADIDSRDNNGCTILGLAARFGNWDAVEYLVKCGAYSNSVDKIGHTVLHLATESGNLSIVEFLVKHGIDINSRDMLGRTPLHLANESGNWMITKYLQDYTSQYHTAENSQLEHSADNNNGENKHCSVMHSAAESGNWDVVMDLVKCGANINSRDIKGRTVLHSAAISGNWDIVKRLVEFKVDVNGRDIHSCTALNLAIKSGNWEIVKHLMENGTDANNRDDRDHTALHYAAENGQLDNIKHFIEHGADINIRDNDGRTPLGLAAVFDNWDIVRYLMKRSAYNNSADDGGRMILHLAALFGHWDVVRCLVELGIDVNSRDIDGRTVLDLAVKSDDWDTVKFLVQHGADANDRDDKGCTALHYALTNNQSDSVRYLIEHGANINSRDNKGCTALCCVAKCGDLDTMKYLVECGADVKNRTDDGYTALHYAVVNGQLDAVQYLLEHNADVNCRDNRGRTALNLAANSNNSDIVKYLLQYGSNVKNREDGGYTALHYAAANDQLDTIKYLIKYGANINYRDDNGCTVLYSAVNFGNRDTVSYLVEECGADVNDKDVNGCTVLHSAAWFGNLEIVRYLIKCGADINGRANNGCTPLHYAAAKNQLDTVKYLVECRVDVAVRDSSGHIAQQLAFEKGQMDTFKYLHDVDDGVSEDKWYEKLFKKKE